MTRTHIFRSIALATGLAILTMGLLAQESTKVLETTQKIADKIIRETSFETELTPLAFNVGITQFTIDRTTLLGDDQAWYAYGKLESEKEASGLLGLSFKGQIKLYLNGTEILSESSDELHIQEYTYNRFHFQKRIPVQWIAGENEVLVKCSGGPTSVLMLPIDKLDAKELFVNAMPVSESTPNSHWLINGPWLTPKGNALYHHFPPDAVFKTFYKQGDRMIGWLTEEVPMLRELIIPETNSYLRDAYGDWHYANGGTMLGILSLYESSGNEAYYEFVKRFAQNLVENDAYFGWQYFTYHAMRGSYHRLYRKTMLDDTGGPAIPLSQLQVMDPDSEMLEPILSLVYDYVMKGQERLEDQTFSRPEPEPATVWADDLFMSVPFLLRMAQVTKDKTLYDEVARQVIQFNQYLSDPATDLYFHGWYNMRGETTPVRWGRANGWIVWATSEALLHMPKKHPQYKTILKIYKQHMEALARYQDPSGMWHQVLDHPETFEESSCTAMFTLGLARGVRMGWLKKSYKEQALKGWNALQNKIGEDGTVIDICRGTGIGDDVDFYENRKRFDHDPRGLGAMLTAGCEIYELLNQ